ncbi:MAG TPA: PASTA domain-containing protein, partial [Longimicrobium sp.]|nr:PASTA domain-containing protein [Longimicrobium sp.]
DLSGRTVDQARRLLAAAGLEVGRVAEGQGSGTPGTVVQQQPRAGSAVAPKSAVQLWLAPQASTPQEPTVTRPPVTRPPPVTQALVTVPRLAGRTVEDARTTLARIDLQVGTVAEAAGTGAPGTIVRQSPRPGMPVLRGSSVQVWIVPARVAQQPRDTPAPDPMMVRVPNVVGQTVEDARETLSAARLTLGTLEEAAGTGTPGTIARQQPAAGSAMLPNSRVGVWLVPARRAIMPAIMGLPLDRAREMVRQAGLRPGEVVGSGRVIGHTFQAGESVRVGSVVNISLGVPPGSVGPVATRPDPPPPAGPQPQPQPPVQRPTPGTTPGATPTPTPGTTSATPAVPVAVDSGAVPDVRRLTQAQAQATLAAAGFTAVFDTALADSVGWRVTAQQPGPGARLAPGGLVALLLDPPPAVAVAPPVQPPAATGTQGPAAPAPRADSGRKTLWIALAALLLIVAAAAGAWRMRARGSAPPIAGVSARFRTDAPARVAVEGMPFGDARLRFRMNPGRTVARVAATGPLFVSKEVTGE